MNRRIAGASRLLNFRLFAFANGFATLPNENCPEDNASGQSFCFVAEREGLPVVHPLNGRHKRKQCGLRPSIFHSYTSCKASFTGFRGNIRELHILLLARRKQNKGYRYTHHCEENPEFCLLYFYLNCYVIV